jgi:hypothetical protein
LLRKLEEQKKQQQATILGTAILILGLIALLAAFGGKE